MELNTYILPVCQKLRKLSSLLPHEQDSLLLLESEAEPNGNELECEDGINKEIGDEQIDTVLYHGDEESAEKFFEWTHAENNILCYQISHSQLGFRKLQRQLKLLWMYLLHYSFIIIELFYHFVSLFSL